jgi:hypothetical protein
VKAYLVASDAVKEAFTDLRLARWRWVIDGKGKYGRVVCALVTGVVSVAAG